MRPCSVCATPIEAGALSCPRCGVAVEAETRAQRPGRRIRLVAAAATLAALAAVALPAVARLHTAEGCQPRSFTDWSVAVGQACVTPAYVCEHMRTSALLQDPELDAAFRRALESGTPGAIGRIDALVDHVRDQYGCDGARAPGELHASGGAEALPPGHPPIGGGARALPPGHPPIGRAAPALPPGHPPIQGDADGEAALPPGHPPIGGQGALPPGHPPVTGPLAPTFDAPGIVTI